MWVTYELHGVRTLAENNTETHSKSGNAEYVVKTASGHH